MTKFRTAAAILSTTVLALGGAAVAVAAPAGTPLPADILPKSVTEPAAIPTPPAPAAAPAIAAPAPAPVWTKADAQALLDLIKTIGSEGLIAADYRPADLAKAISSGDATAWSAAATQSFTWLAEDLRDGRTPMTARKQWFVVDPDVDSNPTALLLAAALEQHAVKKTLLDLAPKHPDYAALKAELAKTPATETKKIAMIRANMDRWRWLGQDFGKMYLMTNVPEMMLRLTVNNKIITTYRTIVGKPGRTATPQLAEVVEGVIFNPTWTVPQSIVKGEGLGAKVLGNPGWAKAAGYKATKNGDGSITVVQQPGPTNSLGKMKLDMPNPQAIFIHDTPNRNLFALDSRALSHGCIRSERASELAMMMAMLGAGMTKEEGVQHTLDSVYTKVPFTKTFPVYITYFTMARDVNGELKTFSDIYGRDAPVLASFAKPRELKTGQRKTSDEVIVVEDDMKTT